MITENLSPAERLIVAAYPYGRITDAILHNPQGNALAAGRMTVAGAFLAARLVASGQVRMVSTRVNGLLSLRAAHISNPDAISWNAERIEVSESVFFQRGFRSEGRVVLAARVRLRVDTPPHAINLSQAHIEFIDDDPATWPQELRLTGCSYQAIYPAAKISVRDRISWLRRDPEGYRPQPYHRLIAAYQAAGEDQHAKRVALENQRRRRVTLAWPGRIAGYLLDATVGYGYRTWLDLPVFSIGHRTEPRPVSWRSLLAHVTGNGPLPVTIKSGHTTYYRSHLDCQLRALWSKTIRYLSQGGPA